MQKLTDQQKAAIDQSIPGLGTHGSGRSAGDIIDSLYRLGGTILPYTSNATADTQDTVAHNLGYIPNGFIVINSDKAAKVYKGSTAWTATNIYLKCDVTSAATSLLVF